MAKLEVALFGYPGVKFDGQPVRVDTRKAIALLAYLVVSGEAPSRDTLAGLLWPDYDQSSARGALRRTLSVLNKATGGAMLDIERERVGLLPGTDVESDVRAFEQAIRRSETLRSATGAPTRAYLDALSEASGRYHERFLAGFALRDAPAFDEWQYLQAEQYAQQFASALERLAYGYAALGDLPAALDAARRWLAQDGLIEEAHRLVMQLSAKNGQRGAALRQYRECVRTLEQELGVEPLAETTALYHAILENRVETHPPLPDEPAPHAAPGAQPARYPLVGRAQETARLQQVYARARQAGQFVLREGEAGIGKSRLADEFLNWAGVNGATCLAMRCFEGEGGLAYAAFASGLIAAAQRPALRARLDALPPPVRAELSRLAPDLFGGSNLAAERGGAGSSSRFLESVRQGLTRLLEGSHPGVLWLDDLQWADAGSMDLLAYFLRRLQSNPIVVLAGWRSDVPASAGLLQIVHDAQRMGSFHRLKLERLRAEDVSRLAENALPAGTDHPQVAERLQRETEGLPFFVVEYLELLRQRASEASQNPADAWTLPASVRDVLRQRLSGVDDAAQQLLGAGAVIGRSFDFSTLREVSGRSELETIVGLEQLTARGLIVENDSGAPGGEIVYDFRHEKLREMMYEETSLARRRLLHRRAAEALAKPGARTAAGGAALVAHHYQQAGMNELAAAYYCDAGDQARAVYANADAAAHYRAALALGHPQPARLHEAIGDVETLRGNYRTALRSYENAAALQQGCLAAIEQKLGAVHARMGALERAERHYQAAMEALDESCPAAQAASILADWSYAAYRQGDIEAAEALAQQALETARRASDELTLAQAHNTLGMLARSRANTPAALEHLQESLRTAQRSDSALVEIAALNNLARLYAEMDSLEQAIETGKVALQRCRQVGDRHREAAILNNLADLLHAHGKFDAAMDYLKQAVTIFAEIGMEGGGMEPEIWKLSEW